MTTYPLPQIFRPARENLVITDPASTSPAGAEPVTAAELKAHGRIDTASEDAVVANQIRAARRAIEIVANRALINRVAVWKISSFPSSTQQRLQLPGGLLASVASIAYLDSDGDSQSWASANWLAEIGGAPGEIGLAFGAAWPTVRDWDLPVTITYTVGYGTAATGIPEDLREAVRKTAVEFYNNRGDPMASRAAPWGARALAMPHRIWQVR